VFVEKVIDLQSDDESSCDDIVIAAINQGHLALKMTDAVLESFSVLHFGRKKMIAILFELLSRGVLVEEDITDLLKALERAKEASRTSSRSCP